MISDKLYGLAFEYKKTKLWNILWDSELFAVKLSNDRIGYICIMGAAGEYCSLGLYIGDEGFRSYCTLLKADEFFMSSFEFQDCVLQQCCLQCSFEGKDEISVEEREEVKQYARQNGIRLAGKNAYPRFSKYQAYCFPWTLQNEEDQEDLCEALSAAIFLAGLLKEKSPGELGILPIDSQTTQMPMLVCQGENTYTLESVTLPESREKEWPKPKAMNDISIAKLRKLQKAGIWECEIIRFPEPVMDEEKQIPVYPAFILAVENSSDYILPISPVLKYEEKPEELLNAFIEAFLMAKIYPMEMKVRDERTFAFAESFCERMNITLSIDEELPSLDDAQSDFMERFSKSEDEKIDDIIDMLDKMLELGPEELENLPDGVVKQLETIVGEGILPKNIQKKLKDIFQFDDTAPQAKKTTKGTFKGSYIISVSLGTGCYRHIQISGNDTLYRLHSAIIDAFEFEDDHAHAFFMDNSKWSDWDSYYAEGVEEGLRTTSKYKLKQVGLYKGKQFKYIFDFGDEWTFQCKVLRETDQSTAAPFIIKRKGDAPQQYPDWDDEWDEDETDE